MGIIYIEGCYKDTCNRVQNQFGRSKCSPAIPSPPCFPPVPEEITLILARLASVEARLATLEVQFGAPIDAIREEFQANLGNTVTVNATFDVIEGTVTTVGTDAVEITTPTGDVFIIPYTSVISIA
ncbi:hypothetical protein [Sutcliffiella horikoshii]|uniref:hypothetical protein n=1 Tax=Sutcliffiella horikoshii TaxID=79883 RepID=UPI00384EED9C